MKKKSILILMLLTTASFGVYAQAKKGNFSVGGSIGFSSFKDEDNEGEYKRTSFGVTPQLGYFLADGVEIGVLGTLQTSKEEYEAADGPKGTDFAVGPYFKYYIFTSNENFAFTVQASALFGGTKDEPAVGDPVKGSQFVAAISPGFSYFFTPKLGLDFQLAGISFVSEKPNKDLDDKTTEFTFGIESFSPTLGFRYFFGK